MKIKSILRRVSVAAVCAVIILGASLVGGCHVFPWFIPLGYSEKNKNREPYYPEEDLI